MNTDRKPNLERDRWFEDAKNADIIEVAQRLGVVLKKSGRDYHAACSLCGGKDKNEFVLTPGNEPGKRFLCRKSGVGGGVAAMVMHCQSIPSTDKGYVEACEFIMGGPPPGDDGVKLSPEEEKAREEKRREQKAKIEADQKRREEEEADRKLSELEKSRRIFDSGSSIIGTPVEAYLKARRASPTADHLKSLRYVPDHPFWVEGEDGKPFLFGRFPCMVAAMRFKGDEFRGIHQTWIDANNPGKKIIPPPGNKAKKMRGEARRSIVLLGSVQRCMAVGEGIETVESWNSLAVGPDDLGLMTSGSLGNLAGGATGTVRHPDNIRLRRAMAEQGRPVTDTFIPNGIPDQSRPGIAIPDGVEEIIILVDGDSDKARTWATILVAARRFAADGYKVFIHVAPDGMDWNDFANRRADGEELEIPPIMSIEEFEKVAGRIVPKPSRYGRIPFSDLDRPGPEHEYLVRGFLTKGDKSVIGGPSGSGKSFLAIHMALCLARAVPFFGRECEKALVVYQAGEGARGIKKRLRAYRKHFGVPPSEDVPFELLTSQVDLYAKDGDTNGIVEEIQQIKADWPEVKNLVFFIDTLATATAGADENSGKDMSAVMKNIDVISSKTGAHVCLVHHLNAAGTKLRGHTSIFANLDQVLMVTENPTTKVKTAVLGKQKDDENGLRIQFELKQIYLADDDRGEPVTSCVCLNVGEKEAIRKEEESKGIPLYGEANPYFRAVLDAIKTHGEPVPLDMDLPDRIRNVVQNGQVNSVYAGFNPIDDDLTGKTDDEIKAAKEAHWDKLKKRVKNARDRLVNLGVIGAANNLIWWTGKPVRGFRETMPLKEAPVSETSEQDKEMAKELEGVDF